MQREKCTTKYGVTSTGFSYVLMIYRLHGRRSLCFSLHFRQILAMLRLLSPRTYLQSNIHVLQHDGIELNTDSCKLASIIRACKLHNDVVSVRMPIGFNLHNLILQEFDEIFLSRGQPYLSALYKAITVAGYYGMMRISELVGKHSLKAEDVKVSKNRKVKMVLRSSKTHHCGNAPQLIDIVPDREVLGTIHCPYNILSNYSLLRPKRSTPGASYFVFSDSSCVTD